MHFLKSAATFMPHPLRLAIATALCWQQAAHAAAVSLPTGGGYVAGAGAIHASGNALTINQSTLRGIIDWNNFSIGQGGTVTFNNGSGATLNRVTGGQISTILGSLIGSGSIYLLTPAGLLIGPGGHIKTGGDFVASTLNISNDAFLTGGSLLFQGQSKSSVVNLGNISSDGGSVFLIGHDVSNGGSLSASNGTVGLGSGAEILIKDSTSDQRIFVKAGAGDVTNTGTIRAAQAELKSKGGNVYALAGNNGGEINVTGTATINGQAWLIADGGTTTIAATISAKNADGTGGHVETSGSTVKTTKGSAITTGRGGSWLLDPDDLTIDSVLASTIEGSLSGYTSVIESTSASGTGGVGDINVNSNISWATSASFTLSAFHNINVANAVTIANTSSGNLILGADNAATGAGAVIFNGTGKVDFSTSTGAVSILYNPPGAPGVKYNNPANYASFVETNGSWTAPPDGSVSQLTPYMLVNNMTDLQNVSVNLAGDYGLGTSLNASATTSFNRLGNTGTPFTGIFDGQGNTISNFAAVGLFGASSGTIRNLGLINAAVSDQSDSYVGGIVGTNSGYIGQVYFNGLVNGATVGGLAGNNSGTINDSYAMGAVHGSVTAGGAAGLNSGNIATSYSTMLGAPLVGTNSSGMVFGSFWDTTNSGVTLSTAGGTGVPRTTMQQGLPSGWSTTIWKNGGYLSEYPFLQWQFLTYTDPIAVEGNVYTNQSRQNPLSGTPINGMINGVDLGQTVVSGADGYYYFLLPQSRAFVVGGGVITYMNSALNGGLYGNAFSSVVQSLYNLPITENYLTTQSWDPSFTSMVGKLLAAAGGTVSNSNLLFSIAAGNILTPTKNLDLMTGYMPMVIDQPIDVPSLILEGYSNLTQTAPIHVTDLTLLALGEAIEEGAIIQPLGVQPLVPAGGNYTLTNTSNQISVLAAATSRNLAPVPTVIVGTPLISPLAEAGSNINVTASGNLAIGITDAAKGVTVAGKAIVNAAGSLTLDVGIPSVKAGSSGLALVLDDGTSFTNNSGLAATSFATPNGTWQLWSQNPANDIRGGIAYNFKQYDATYGTTAPAQGTGDGVFYTDAPILTAIFGPVTREYNGTTTASINTDTYSPLGVIDGDTVTISGPASGTFSNKNAGSGKTITVNGVAITSSLNGEVPVYGYQINSTQSAAVGTITKAPVSVTIDASNKVYDGTVTASATSQVLGQLEGDVVTLAPGAAYSFSNKNVGTDKPVSESGMTLAGADGGNYYIIPVDGSANITAATLLYSANDGSRLFGEPNPTFSGSITGLKTGDSLSSVATGALLFTSPAAPANLVGVYAIDGSGLTLTTGNYTLSQAPGNATALSIAPLTVVIGNVLRNVGQTTPPFTVSYSGPSGDYLNNLLPTLVLMSNAPSASIPGIYQITGTVPSSLIGDLVILPGTLIIASPTPVLPAALQTQAPLTPNPLPFFAGGSNNLLPGNAVSAFQVTIQPSQNWLSLFPTSNLSNSSFTQTSPDGNGTGDTSTYAAGAKP